MWFSHPHEIYSLVGKININWINKQTKNVVVLRMSEHLEVAFMAAGRVC